MYDPFESSAIRPYGYATTPLRAVLVIKYHISHAGLSRCMDSEGRGVQGVENHLQERIVAVSDNRLHELRRFKVAGATDFQIVVGIREDVGTGKLIRRLPARTKQFPNLRRNQPRSGSSEFFFLGNDAFGIAGNESLMAGIDKKVQ